MLNALVYGNTNPGLVRGNNEDAFIAQKIWDDNHWLMAVIDGLGGYEGGEVAAAIAKETIIRSVEGKQNMDCLDVIMQSVVEANNTIFNQRSVLDGLNDMGCVITASILDLEKKQLNVAHVGDTRLYLCNNNGLLKLTHDHSFVGGLEDEGHISEKDAMNHPRRNLIDRIVGEEIKDIDTPRFIEAAVFPVSIGNQYLLCSDGLSDMLTSEEMISVLQKESSVKNKVNRLIEFANNQGGKDNITAIVANIIYKESPKNLDYTRLPKGNKTKNKRNKKHKNKKKLYTQTKPEDKATAGLYKIGFIALMIIFLLFVFILLS